MKDLKERFLNFLNSLQSKIRNFDYSDLSFLYIACLVTIAFVYTIFRVSQYYLSRQEVNALQAIQQVSSQRERISELERLIAFAQNRTAPQYPLTVKLLVENYGEIVKAHSTMSAALPNLRIYCRQRECGDMFNKDFFSLSPQRVERDLNNIRLGLRTHNRLLQQLFNEAVRYHVALKDSISVSFNLIHTKNKTNMTFDFIAYFSLIVLLLVQAVYVFRPAIRRLNASLSTRSDFLSRISHEIRNPMNSIIGMADILKGTKLNYEQQHYVDNLIRSGHALLDMLNNLIDSSALERGKLTLKPNPFDLQRTVDRCLNLVSIQAHHKNINMYLRMTPDVPYRLIGDSVRLEQVLINLLSNAVKFTEQGYVALDVEVASEDARQVQLVFAIQDTGIGIRNEQLGEIFESFVQADSSIQRKYGGSGLGLSISTELIRMMGGELQVTSEYGQGSRFFFTVTMDKQFTREYLDPQPLKRLIDSEFVLMVSYAESSAYQGMFTKLGARVSLLHSSQELRRALANEGCRDARQVLIDDSIGIISMIACRNLLAEQGFADRTVAVIRSNFTKENMDLLKRNGFMRFLIKPLKPWELLTLPVAVHSDDALPVSASSSVDIVRRLREKNLKVLLVDDSNDNLFLLKEVVSPLASNIHFAENGLEAIEKFTRNPYDAVFMDIQMPVMDGYTAIRKIREIETKAGKGQRVPIYAVTAHAGLVDAQKCREAGFTDRIVKPVVRSDIYKSLSKAFALEASDVDLDADPGLPTKYLAKLMPTFLKTRAEDMEKLNTALKGEDFVVISQLGHKMKGSSASYGIVNASKLSAELERSAKEKNLESCTRIAAELEAIFQKERDKLLI